MRKLTIIKMMKELVNHPKHYNTSKYETADVLDAWFPTEPLLWQAGKYLSRALHKEDFKLDLQKAIWYLERRLAKAVQDESISKN